MDLEQIKSFRLTNTNKYFRKLTAGADANIPGFVDLLLTELKCSLDDLQTFDDKQINFYRTRSSDLNNYFSVCFLTYLYLSDVNNDENITLSKQLMESLLPNDTYGFAATKLGYIYAETTFKDPVKEYEYTKMGCDKGNVTAMTNMSIYYEINTNIPNHLDEAIRYCEMAIANGSVRAKCNLASLYHHYTKFRNIELARKLYEETIREDYGRKKASALRKLGMLYHDHAVTVSPQTNANKALEYYTLCANFMSFKGTTGDAARRAGDIYFSRQNYKESRHYYELAQRYESLTGQSCLRLASSYLEGKGGDVNILQGIRFCYLGNNYWYAKREISKHIDDIAFLMELINRMSYDDFAILYDNHIPDQIYELFEKKRLTNILIEI